MSTLAEIRAAIAGGLAAHEATCGRYVDDPSGFHARYQESIRALSADLSERVGVNITDRYDGCRVRAGGVTASSTGGLASALRNWMKAADKRGANG